MEELPELPFKQVFSYLSLKDRLKARTVSRGWRNKFDRYPVKSLCYSSRPSDFILGKSRWVRGAFAENFINSTRFASFFKTYGRTILSDLKHLRFCVLELSKGDLKAFTRILNSFSQLERLDIIRVDIIRAKCDQQREFKLKKLNIIWAALKQRKQQERFDLNLNLPMLTSLQIEYLDGIEKLTLEAPRLRDVKILAYLGTDLSVEFVHGESVERLLVDPLRYTEVKKLKNLQYLYVQNLPVLDPTFLSSLQQLKEIHTNEPQDVPKLFEQKQRLGRADLKIYLCGLLLNGPDDPAINALRYSSLGYPSEESFSFLAGNQSRLADQIPFYSFLDYSYIKKFLVSGMEVDFLKRFIHLREITVYNLVRDIERFLNLLKNYKKIVNLVFHCDQPQDLFDRLPEHCTVQLLVLDRPPSDLAFLFRLKSLISLHLYWPIDIETVQRAFEELPALSSFKFRCGLKSASIYQSKHEVEVELDDKKTFSDLKAAIEFIFKNQ